DPVTQLLLVHQHALLGQLPLVEPGVELLQDRLRVVGRGERDVRPRHPELVVGMEVVGRREERHHPGEALLAQPDDLLLAADLAVVAGVAAGPLRDGDAVLDHPREVARGDAGGPLAPHTVPPPDLAGSPTSLAAWTVSATSCARTMATPCS